VSLTIAVFIATAAWSSMSVPDLPRICLQLLMTAAMSAVAAWLIEKQSRRNFLDARQLARLAELDPLTGTRNRRVFEEHLARLWQQAIRDSRPLAVLLADVDHFKPFNDRYGHQAGDLALQRVASAIQGQLSRPLDLLARYGGEEFGVLLYDSDAGAAQRIAERIRTAVRALDISHFGSPQGCLTASIGVGSVRPQRDRAPAGVVQLADEALYAAKMQGRDRVHMATEVDYQSLETGVFERPSLRHNPGQRIR
jgi:diguanylate cyclase (GGDEF)-like protein